MAPPALIEVKRNGKTDRPSPARNAHACVHAAVQRPVNYRVGTFIRVPKRIDISALIVSARGSQLLINEHRLRPKARCVDKLNLPIKNQLSMRSSSGGGTIFNIGSYCAAAYWAGALIGLGGSPPE